MQHQLEHVRGEIEHLRQLFADCVQQNGTERVQTQALMKATPRKLVKVK
jgi:TolA-binding protein